MYGLDEEVVEDAAYKMQSAYLVYGNMYLTVAEVYKDTEGVTEQELCLMWSAIDAFADINT